MEKESYYFVDGKKIPIEIILEALGNKVCPHCLSPTVFDGVYCETYCTNNDCNNAMNIITQIKRDNIVEVARKIKEDKSG